MTPILFAAAATVAAASTESVSTETGLARLEREAYSWHLLQRRSRPPNPALVLVAADDAFLERIQDSAITAGRAGRSLQRYRRAGCDCPISRSCYAGAVRRLAAWHARVVVLDIEFRSRGHAGAPGHADEDAELASAIEEAGNVAVSGSTEMLPLDPTSDPARAADLIIQPPTAVIQQVVGKKWGSPRVDPQGGAYLFEPLQTAFRRDCVLDQFPALPYVAAALYQHRKVAGLKDVRPWASLLGEDIAPRLLGDFFAPTRARETEPLSPEPLSPEDSAGFDVIDGGVVLDEVFNRKGVLINFSVGADPLRGRYLPVRLSWLLDMPDELGRKQFQDKLVIVGLPGHDLHKTVVGRLPGQEILANATATMLDRNPIRPVGTPLVLALMLAASLAAALMVRSLPTLPATLAILAELAALQVVAALLLDRYDTALMSVTPSAAIGGAALAAGVWESRRVRGLVARLLPERLFRAMERAGGFQVEEGSVLFSDIRGYSTFSERLGPAELMTQLNAYFAAVQRVLARHGGHFVKSPGDCVVAWFAEDGRPSAHRQRAITAGLEILRNAQEFKKPWEEAGLHPFAVGVGINSGPMAVGVLDAHRHIEPTVIGDSVNVAARIEELAHEDASLLVSEETLAPVRSAFLSDYLGEYTVPGRARQVRVYRVLGLGPAGKPGGAEPRGGRERSGRGREAPEAAPPLEPEAATPRAGQHAGTPVEPA